ncbi:MAG: acyl carrier protein [Chloroflexi bacterium]|nr:acyl carrier protein [Chloroflexota bacterium]|tara:strand:+ start:9685 stop:9897 length:213 start_codon:yes stop_codon:yes gene_type:complete
MSKNKEIISIIEQISDKEINNYNLRFVEDLNFDSLDTVVLLSRLEKELDIYVKDSEVQKLITVQHLIDFI